MAEEEEKATAEIIGLVNGTVEELKEYVRENDIPDEQLQKILKAEINSKNRKTAVNFLKEQMGEKEEVEIDEEVSEIDRETLLQILGGTVEDVKKYVREKDPSDDQLQEILHAEKMVNDRVTVERFLKSYSKKKDVKTEIKDAKHDLAELKSDLEAIEQDLDQDIDISEIDLIDEEGEDVEQEEDEETDSEDDSEQSEGDKEDQDEEAEEQEESSGEKEENSEEENEEENKTELEKKKDIAEELEADLSEEELEEISLEELEKIRDEKDRRKELIDELKEEFDEEELRKASTSDLEKLRKGLESEEDNDDEEDEMSVEEKNKEMREEAQEDLEMLKGAVKSKDNDEGDGKGKLESLTDAKDNFGQNLKNKIFFMGSDEDEEDEGKGMKEGELLELLDEYSELDGYEAAIKTAHIMKSYLEYSQGIDRELTYRELGEEIDAESEDMERVLEFFDRMHKDQYTGNITENMDEVIEASKKVVKG